MSDRCWLTDAQMTRLEPFFPKFHGKPLVDERHVLSGIVFINSNGLRWREAPLEYGGPKILYSRSKRQGEKGVFVRMLLELSDWGSDRDTLKIDATDLKTHRTAYSLGLRKGAAVA